MGHFTDSGVREADYSVGLALVNPNFVSAFGISVLDDRGDFFPEGEGSSTGAPPNQPRVVNPEYSLLDRAGE